MASHDSRSEYESRLHRVLAYIDGHLDEPLDLVTLAEIAHFSPFHFHRLFSAWMGETFGDYLRRRRVELAAMRLAAQPRTKVLNIALSVGFGSAEAFTRAFKSRFGCSPTAWREQQYSRRQAKSNSGQAIRKHGQALQASLAQHDVSRKPNPKIIMKVTLIGRQPATVAYFRHLGPYGESIARFWQETYVPSAVMNKLGADHARYGISHDDPGITAPALFSCTFLRAKELVERYEVGLSDANPSVEPTRSGLRAARLKRQATEPTHRSPRCRSKASKSRSLCSSR